MIFAIAGPVSLRVSTPIKAPAFVIKIHQIGIRRVRCRRSQWPLGGRWSVTSSRTARTTDRPRYRARGPRPSRPSRLSPRREDRLLCKLTNASASEAPSCRSAPITLWAFFQCAIWMAARPTPPSAPVIRTVSSRPRSPPRPLRAPTTPRDREPRPQTPPPSTAAPVSRRASPGPRRHIGRRPRRGSRRIRRRFPRPPCPSNCPSPAATTPA